MASPLVAGVDVGTSAARAVVIDNKGQVVAASRAAYRPSSALPVGEADPRVWLEGCV